MSLVVKLINVILKYYIMECANTWESKKNSGGFPNYQCIMLQDHAILKEPLKFKTD